MLAMVDLAVIVAFVSGALTMALVDRYLLVPLVRWRYRGG